jgi:hypothetical protein
MRALPLLALGVATFGGSLGVSLGAQQPGPNGASSATTTVIRASAARAATTPVIDGKAGEAAWNDAPVIDQFLEYEPTTGAESRFRTEVRILYDNDYFYLQARMFDPAPDSIISLLGRRDVRVESEQFKILIDSYHDRRTGYQFALNPAGVKRDFYVYNDNTEDASWDAVWDGAASIDSVGWVAEFRIPFSQMRFADKEAHTFGLLMVRDIARTRQRNSWPLYHRNRQGYVSQSGEIEGIERIPRPSRLEILPYAVTKNITRQDGPSDWSHPQEQTIGADVKWGITSNLTVDATINPDFGQVEADPAVLNLGAFEQFFEERRPFFLEGAGIFTFRNSCGDIDTGCRGLFYSRRIGRAPQLGGLYSAPDNPTASRVLGAAKLSGRLSSGLNIGVLNAITGHEIGAGDQTIEPQTNYSVVRVLQDLNNGRSGIGAMFTATNRTLDADTRDFLRSEAFTGGIDFRHRFFDNNYELTANVSGSVVRGSALAIAATQRDGIHRFQRRDDDLEYDPTRTSLSGDAQRVTVSKFGGGITRFQSVLQRFSPEFEINDLGFQQRADEQMFRNWFQLGFNTPTKYFRRLSMNFNTFNTWTDEGMLTNYGLNTNWHMELPNTHWLHFGVDGTPAAVSFDDRSSRGGVAFRRAANFSIWGGWEGNRSTWYTPTFFAGTYRGDEWRTRGYWFEPGFQFRAGPAFNASIGISASHDINDSQWFNNYGDIVNTDTAHITFAQLDQWTMSLTTRINYTMSPTLSLQIYAQPFTSIGDYTEWKELTATPRARKYDDRFQPYGGGADPGGVNFKQLNTNTVLRWEYRPGSILFLVWQQGRDDFQQGPTGFQFRRDFGEFLKLHPNNTFLIKMSYWFNP